MAKRKTEAPTAETTPAPAEYTVVARRYRPQQFAELIGQEHVAGALVNALNTGRVAHAYLFTGARGVGKTSAARILAKALNCERGPTPTPCDVCESCKAVAEGQDVDVVEIDGASNNRIDEARDLRQNIGFRPTRSRYKIYIIDEVHMLTTQAFNALLKTLEEPPPHVKFIFATTEVQKIPITILSRCQRFDFAHVGPSKIFAQLKSIAEREHHEADEDALRIIAKRAAGSMRDSQSLLDQLLASAAGRLTVEHVQAVLGTASDDRVTELAAAVLTHDAKTAVTLIGNWIERGLQIGELIDQLIDYWRALMLAKCAPELPDLPVAPNQRAALIRQASALTLDAILTGLDIWTTTKARTRGSSHTQVLLEMAVVRLARLDELLSVGQLAQALSQHAPAPVSRASSSAATPIASQRASASSVGVSDKSVDLSKKNGILEHRRVDSESPKVSVRESLELTEKTLPSIWKDLLQQFSDRAPILANHLKPAGMPAIFGPNALAIRFPFRYSHSCEAVAAESNLNRIKDVLQRIVGTAVAVRTELQAATADEVHSAHATAGGTNDRRKQLMELPLFKKAGEALGAQMWHVDDGFDPNRKEVAAVAQPAADAELDDSPLPAPDPDED